MTIQEQILAHREALLASTQHCGFGVSVTNVTVIWEAGGTYQGRTELIEGERFRLGDVVRYDGEKTFIGPITEIKRMACWAGSHIRVRIEPVTGGYCEAAEKFFTPAEVA